MTQLTWKPEVLSPLAYHGDSQLAFQTIHIYGSGKKDTRVTIELGRLVRLRVHNSIHPFKWEPGETQHTIVLQLEDDWKSGTGMLIDVIGERDNY